MTDKEIIIKWKQGVSKEFLSKIYKREYNQEIKIIRANPKHRYSGKYINNYEALKKVENVIYNFIKEPKKGSSKKIK